MAGLTRPGFAKSVSDWNDVDWNGFMDRNNALQDYTDCFSEQSEANLKMAEFFFGSMHTALSCTTFAILS
jgi:hypothetical protein